ncbi:MAG TPA: hypothetical protein VEX64_11665 [Pyrinomonadaceae bacterium]|jgi:hypothetical protein|nr:hypothetical protein [Pyrinomonadaceae bacterium]
MKMDEFNDNFNSEMEDEFGVFETGDDFTSEDDFDSDEDFEPDFELELTNVKRRTAVLAKKDMIAVLGVQTFDQGGTICRVDPREERPAVQLYDDPAEALNWFKRSLRTSRQNGWQVIYDGLPLHG